MSFHLKRVVDISRHKKTANMEEGTPKEICVKCKEIQESCDSLKKSVRNLKVIIKNKEEAAQAIFSNSTNAPDKTALGKFKKEIKEHYAELKQLKEKIDTAYNFIAEKLSGL